MQIAGIVVAGMYLALVVWACLSAAYTKSKARRETILMILQILTGRDLGGQKKSDGK